MIKGHGEKPAVLIVPVGIEHSSSLLESLVSARSAKLHIRFQVEVVEISTGYISGSQHELADAHVAVQDDHLDMALFAVSITPAHGYARSL